MYPVNGALCARGQIRGRSSYPVAVRFLSAGHTLPFPEMIMLHGYGFLLLSRVRRYQATVSRKWHEPWREVFGRIETEVKICVFTFVLHFNDVRRLLMVSCKQPMPPCFL